jgi:hypothetical protein
MDGSSNVNSVAQGFVHLVAILDAYSCTCFGWKLSKRIDAQVTLGILAAAFAARWMKAVLI